MPGGRRAMRRIVSRSAFREVDLAASSVRNGPFRHERRLGLVPRTLFFHGVRDALAFPAWVVGFSLLGVGSIARDVGYPAGAAVLSTVLVWAGPAQVILFGGLAAGTAPLALAIAVCLSSIRFLPMTMAIMPLLRRPGQHLGAQILAAHYVSVTTWVEGLRRLPAKPSEERLPYYLGFTNACLGLSALTTYAGYYLVGALPVPLAAALLFLTPIFFTLSLAAGAKAAVDWTAILLGFGLAPVFSALVGRDFDLLGTGLVGGTAAYLIGKLGRRMP
jgi:predicted branched-subunit amino acid permease